MHDGIQALSQLSSLSLESLLLLLQGCRVLLHLLIPPEGNLQCVSAWQAILESMLVCFTFGFCSSRQRTQQQQGSVILQVFRSDCSTMHSFALHAVAGHHAISLKHTKNLDTAADQASNASRDQMEVSVCMTDLCSASCWSDSFSSSSFC